ncbi:hypothetical protein SRIM_033235 [Streptomyces rimosus subsp. rimosus ATCC 10970]|uniref:UL36 very large tegument protein n=1 Tax=Streptomyces rimosus subsp. rimosus (strain ATCC 10970 / DSM 40260 / JCM 4667 / NRRL 2234) TaxID=1265868 RepID=A0A8A1V2X8_STRR1|nr:hypothetical protein [Streptomyces sp. SID5471]QDA09372.1 hypothetical protein CTZ40_07370 [Streptomyces rimosus]QGY71589.1 hypothetical protein V519_023550 [Streptomyces rimosus R6-500]QST86339.1 hypothetical protein SRIM_033235 [Streptomyces rimosus subsp. rimosus ATCC 10970]QTL91437.1 hypothetical protein FMM49_07890 [Streptomyces rimosus subsp. rimosus]
MAEFARFLRGLTRLLDETAGWYAVFTLRDPEGMRACLDGTDVPPWDVVESLLHDLAGWRGEYAVRTAGPRARRLHEEAVAAYDARPGAPARLGDRLDMMLRERQYAALRERELRAALLAAAGGPGAARLADELAWARDDHVRSGARARELQGRLDALASAAVSRRFPGGGTGPYEREPDAGSAPRTSGTPVAPAPPPPPANATRLARLRATGRGGEAHALLCAAAHAHPSELPRLMDELESVGLAAEVPTLLWEVACLPPPRLAAAADALTAAGRTAESVRLLRQGVARPVGEVAHTALALLGAGRPAEARELFAALVRARTPEEAVEATASAPGELVPLLLEAAADVSPYRHRDISHALRAGGAGF